MTANEPAESSSASIVNVAAIANVSTATVSRVLSGKRTKDDDIARRVRAAAHSLNYSVNFAASALRSTVTRTIGLIVPSVQDPFSARLIDTLEPLVNQSGVQPSERKNEPAFRPGQEDPAGNPEEPEASACSRDFLLLRCDGNTGWEERPILSGWPYPDKQ